MSSLTNKPLYLETSPRAEPTSLDDVSAVTLMTAVRRHAVAVLLTVFLIPLCTAVVVINIPSRYAATASVQVQTRSKGLRDVQAVSYDNEIDPNIVTTEVDVLHSNDLLLDVVRVLRLDQNPEFVGPPKGLDRILVWVGDLISEISGATKVPPSPEALAMASLRDQTTIVSKERSDVIGITVATHHAALSIRVADTYASQYLKFRRGLKSSAMQQANVMLVDHLINLKQRELAAEGAAEQFRQEHGLAIVTGASPGGNLGPTVVGQQLAELNRQLITASAARAQAEANLLQARALVEAGQADKAPQVLASPVVQHLRGLEADLMSRQAGAASRVVAHSPLLDNLRAQITTVRSRIDDEASKVIASLSTEVKSAQTREATLNTDLQKLRNQLNSQGSETVRLRELEQEATAAGAIYQDFLQQDKRMANGADMQLPDAELIATAKAPLHATYPKRTLVVLGSFAASCIIAALLALRLERSHVGFQSSEEFEAETGMPVLGLLPKLPRRARRRFESSIQPPLYREVLSAICARLWTDDFNGRARVIMIASAVPGEAKTWLAMSLAANFAEAGARTLLIDCDLRRGSIARALGLSGSGLSDLYPRARRPEPRTSDGGGDVSNQSGGRSVPNRETSVLDAARRAGIVRTVAPDFDVIPAFPNAANPAEFLVAAPIRNLIEHARSTYDVILVDTPPVMMVADGILVSRLVDAVLVAARWCHTPRPVVADAIHSLSESGAYVLGGVLTIVDTRKYAAKRLGGNAYVYRNYAGYYGSSR